MHLDVRFRNHFLHRKAKKKKQQTLRDYVKLKMPNHHVRKM